MDVLKKNRFNPAWQAILRKRRRRRWGRLILAPLPGILLGILLGAVGWHIAHTPTPHQASTIPLDTRVERVRTVERIELALQLHQLLHGELPLELEELTRRGLLHRSTLEKSPWVHPLSYRLTPDGFELETPRY